MLKVEQVKTAKQLKEFLKLHYTLSSKHGKWSPMIYEEAKKVILKGESILFKKNEHYLFLAKRDGKTVGRICFGADKLMNEYKNVNHAFFTLFDCEDDIEAAELLINTAEKWAEENGYDYLKGPISPTNGDDNRGVLTEGFDRMNAILNNYNPDYYLKFFEEFDSYLEYYAFEYDLYSKLDGKKLDVIKKLLNKYNPDFKDYDDTEKVLDLTYSIMFNKDDMIIKTPNFKDKKKLYNDVEVLFKESMPKNWEEDLFPPDHEEVKEMIDNFIAFTSPEMVQFACINDKLIGFAATIPELAEDIKKVNGRIFPFGWIRMIKKMKKPEKVRAVLLFISSEYSNLAISGAFIINLRKKLRKIGVREIEFSTISSKNRQMMNITDFLGLNKIKTYTIYGKPVNNKELDLKEIYGEAYKKFIKDKKRKERIKK